MIVRTYGRRNRGTAAVRSYSDFEEDVVSDSGGGFGDSLSQESPRDVYDFAFSSQDSSHWGFDSDLYGLNSSRESQKLAILPSRKPAIGGISVDYEGGLRKPKKARNGKSRNLEIAPAAKALKSKWGKAVVPSAGPNLPTASSTATLMETQEFGEMMEHVDEVNFALDGLKKGQPVRIRRASLLSLLSICGSPQQRRLLRSHGMARTIIDAVLGLSIDDTSSNLASAALFYIFTSDGQDDNLLDSPGCIRFLIKLLKPLGSDATKDKAPTIGSRLLLLRKDAVQDSNKGLDSTATAIMLKVQEIFFGFKEMKFKDGSDNRIDKVKLCPKWIALLTMEKACLSTISLEEISGTVRNTGRSFKERLRELGGLDAVFQVIRSCHSILEGGLKGSSSTNSEPSHNMDPESLVLLLKCLKIMENATFLSMDNQSHLLGMEGCIESQCSPISFTKLILSSIKILSGISLLQSSGRSGNDNEIYHLSYGSNHGSRLPLMIGHKAESKEIICIDSSSMEWSSSQNSSLISQSCHLLPVGQSGSCKSSSAATNLTLADPCLLKMRIDSSISGSCSGTSRSSYGESSLCRIGSKMNLAPGKISKVPEETQFDFVEDRQDPYAFHEDDFEPSKWDLLFGKQKSSQNGRPSIKKVEDGCQSTLILSQQESSNTESSCSHEASSSSSVDEENSNLLADCLLTAVKVLMNLTNENSEGCQQIATCGGLEILCSLISAHFPSFGSHLSHFTDIRESSLSAKSSVEVEPHNDIHLTDHELDFLVAILGLLVNLVEKDGRNRSRLAAASVTLPGIDGLEERNLRDIIPLLCSIFLANQGAGEVAGEGNPVPWDGEEDAVLQGEKEAEKMIVEAYAALLLAFLSTESESTRKSIAECLPDHNLAILVPVLERFVEFHLTLNMISPETHTTVLEVIESCRIP